MSVRNQRGATLFVAMMLLIVLSILGIIAARSGLLQSLMAANTQQSAAAFSAAQSASDAFIQAANATDPLDPSNIDNPLLIALRDKGMIPVAASDDYWVEDIDGVVQCVGEDGGVADCANQKIDASYASTTTSTAEGAWYGCPPQPCPGFSAGVGTSGLRCQYYRVDGTGTVGDVSTTVSTMVRQVGACAN